MRGYVWESRWSVEIFRFKLILGENVRGRGFEKVVRYVLGGYVDFPLSIHPTNKILVFKKNLGIYSQTQVRGWRRLSL